MNIVNYMNHFWLNNQYEPCSPSETALYHYLLFEAERQQWAMPFRIPTQMVMTYTGISKQGVKDARESLRKRGFITYSKPYTPLFTITLTNYIRNNIAVLQLRKVLLIPRLRR